MESHSFYEDPSYITMINDDIHVVNVRPHEVVKFLFMGYSFIVLGFYYV